MLSSHAHAQSLLIQTETTSSSIKKTANDEAAGSSTLQVATTELSYSELPDAPGLPATNQQTANQTTTDQKPTGSISSTVLDPNGAQVEGALVTLDIPNSKNQPTATTDSTGSFKFNAVNAGTFKLTIISKGFAPWVSGDIVLLQGQTYEMPAVALQIASAKTDVDVTFTHHDIANEQIALEEKQRVLGVIPNFYVTYTWNAASLSAGQKFRLATRASIDPVTIGISAAVAGIEQADGDFKEYGPGGEGYAKRFAASYSDSVIGTFIGGAILPSIFHQDPRYFYKGTGSITSRALYAISTVVICKGDNGRWQPNYSSVLGDFAAAGLANYYYPPTNRDSAGLFVDNVLIGTAAGAGSALIQEFIVRRFTRHPPPAVPAAPNPTP